jgi:acylphosphatase
MNPSSESPPPDAAPPPEGIVRARALVRGRVQGVGYRMYAEFEAQRRHLTGWVRNHGDTQVECEMQGPRPEVESMVEWCRKGPPSGRVSGVQIEWIPTVEGEEGFGIRRSV